MKAKLIEVSDLKHAETLANILLEGGVVGALWGYHLYFLACNAFDQKATARMNKIKGRNKLQVLASPGAVEEAEEFAQLQNCRALNFTSKKMGMSPKTYLEFLFKKFPIAVELFANSSAPSTVTFATKDGNTIWIAAHSADKNYSKFLVAVRTLRRSGKNIVFAGTSMNLKGENTLTIRDFDKVIKDFGEKLDAIAVHQKNGKIKKLKFSTSSSVVSFIGNSPKLLRLGAASVVTLKKYIPDLQIPENISTTRR